MVGTLSLNNTWFCISDLNYSLNAFTINTDRVARGSVLRTTDHKTEITEVTSLPYHSVVF